MDKKEIELYSWIIRGSQRTRILKIFEGQKTPTQIKKITGLGLNNVSDNLRLFVKQKIAKCLNEKEKLGRIYTLTEVGEKIKNKLN